MDHTGLTRLEKCELTYKRNRWERFKADFPHLDPQDAERIFQLGYHSGYGRALRQSVKMTRENTREQR